MKTKNANIEVTTITQSSNELLGKKETNLYYLVITTETGKMTINVGEKTHNQVKQLTEQLIEQIETHKNEAKIAQETQKKSK